MDILIVKPKWAELILSRQKTWEIRGSNTNKRGLIGIAESGTGKVYGEVELIDSRAMFYADFVEGAYNHKLSIVWGKLQDIYPQPYIWELRNAKRYDEPKPYNHPKGAVIWVKGEETWNLK